MSRRWSCAVVGCGALLSLPACVAEAPVEGLEGVEQGLTVCADGPTLEGIDVSKWQGSVDWRAVAASGVDFAFIRVSDGLQYRDEYFDANWEGARANGILRGTYQFFRPGQDALAQADLLLERMGPLEPGDLPPVIDVEATDNQPRAVIVAKIRQWLDRVEAATGVRPIIYTGKYFWQDNVATTEFNDYPLWVAQYGPVCPNLPDQWSQWSFFQNSSTGRVPGVSGNVDTNFFNGDLNALMAMTSGDPICGDDICHLAEREGVCPGDCPVCEPVPAEGRIIEEGDLCFTGGGDPRWLRRVEGGHEASLIWTHATDSDAVESYGLWTLAFERPGDYLVEAFIDPAWAETRQAAYEIAHAGQTSEVVVDQSAQEGWSALGAFTFAAGGDQHVRLDDNTGEPLADQLQIVFDALRLTPLDPPVEPEPSPEPEPEAQPEPEGAPEPEAQPEPSPGAEPEGGPGVEPEGSPEPFAGDREAFVKGGCATPGSPLSPPRGGSWLLWAGLALVGVVRARRCA